MPKLHQANTRKLSTQFFGFIKFLLVLILVYFVGNVGVSVAWVGVLSVFVYIWLFEGHAFIGIQQISSLQTFGGHDADPENTLWLSKLLERLWPYTKDRIELFMRTQLQTSIKKNLPSTLKSFTFTTIKQGKQAPQVLNIEIKDSDKSYIVLDIAILYSSDTDIGFAIGALESSIRDIQISGTLRIVLTELNNFWPYFGKMNLSFVTPPLLHFKLAKAARLFDFTGFRDIIHENINDQLTTLLVLPHFVTFPISDNYTSSTSYPPPEGILRVHINRAKDLPITEQREQVDPYCVVQVGAKRCKTCVIQKTNQPMWEEYFEFLVNDRNNQYVEIQCIDSADTCGVGSLGSCFINIAGISFEKNMWLFLDKNSGSSISVTCSWLDISSDINQLPDPELDGVKWKSTSLVAVGIESASGLPSQCNSKKSLKNTIRPMIYVKVTLNDVSYRTTPVQNPVWGENFYLLSSHPAKQELVFEVFDEVSESLLGLATVPLFKLLETPTLTGTQLKLENSLTEDAYLRVNLSIKALVKPSVQHIPEFSSTKKAADRQSSAASAASRPLVRELSSASVTKEFLQASTPNKISKPKGNPGKMDVDDSDAQSDILDFDNWSDTESNVIAGGSTYIVISRPDGSTVSEIVQNANDSTFSTKENVAIDQSKHGKVQLTLRYSQPQQKLIIAVHQICNLLPMNSDKDSLPDPFIVITLYNQKVKVERKKTKHQKGTLSPIFDETFEFKVSKSLLENAVLELRIKNRKRIFQKGKSNLGSVVLRLEALNLTEPRTEWFLIKSLKDSMESLNDTTISQNSTIRA